MGTRPILQLQKNLRGHKKLLLAFTFLIDTDWPTSAHQDTNEDLLPDSTTDGLEDGFSLITVGRQFPKPPNSRRAKSALARPLNM